LLDFDEILYVVSLWVCRGRAVIEIHLPWNPRWGCRPNIQSLNGYNSSADSSI